MSRWSPLLLVALALALRPLPARANPPPSASADTPAATASAPPVGEGSMAPDIYFDDITYTIAKNGFSNLQSGKD